MSFERADGIITIASVHLTAAVPRNFRPLHRVYAHSTRHQPPLRDVTSEDTNSPLIVQKGVLVDSAGREILHAKETTMEQHFTKIKAVAGQEFAISLFHMLQADSLDGGERLARILKRRQDDQAMTLRSRIALIRAR